MTKQSPYTVKVTPKDFSLWKNGRPLLTHLDMELTERCNNNCIHCYINLPADDHRAKKRELSTEEIEEILKEAASLGCLTVRFTGGEPLLREDFEEIYLFARRLGLKVVLFTNGTLITPHLAGVFARIPPLKEIRITIYGMERRSYEAITRSPGSFEAAFRGTQLLKEKEIPFIVKGVLLPPNKKDMVEFENWALTIPWMKRTPSYAIFLDLRCRRDSEEKNAIIKNLRPPPDEALQVLTKNGDDYISEMRVFCAKFTGPPGKQLFACGAGIGQGCVDAYGYFQLCMMLRYPGTVYNLKKGSLEDSMKNFVPKVREIKAQDYEYLNRCARCFIQGLCQQCPARSWMEYGTLDGLIEYYCEIAQAQARHLGLMKEGEKPWMLKDWEKRITRFSSEGTSAAA